MKFEIHRASRHDGAPVDGALPGPLGRKWFIEIDTLEDLMALRERVGDDLVLGGDSITIYDDYME
jgi:hypothetical protein